jgi:hypothetical protein
MDDKNEFVPTPGEVETPQSSSKLAQGASSIAHKGKEEFHRLADKAKDRARTEASDVLSKASEKLHGVTQNLDELAVREPMLRKASDGLRKVTQRLDATSPDELIATAKRELRNRPALGLGACFALGFLAARLLKE